ncbi:MAG: hypothetical protein H6627_13915 [Calditrichae bacterium]|nr:hypothetical protein [Calditrichia bacterium]
MRKLCKSLKLLSFLLILTSCTHFNYIGDSYSPTKDVMIYFSEKEIKSEYRIMGHAVVAGEINVSVDDLKQRLIKEAKENGADAILIKDIYRDAEFDGDDIVVEKQIKASFLKFDS